MPLRNQNAISFLATANASKSKLFFEQTLGLHLIEETDFALVFLTGDVQLRIQKVEQISPTGYTSMGWQIDNIEALVAVLSDRGVVFDQCDGLEQSQSGIWTSPSGAKVAWFKDPDGNTLSLTEL